MHFGSLRSLAPGAVLAGVVALAFLAPGKEQASPVSRNSMPFDWSHRHVIFSNPSTPEQSMRVRQDPRFWHQWMRRNVRQALPAESDRVGESVSRQDDDTFDWRDGDWFGWFLKRHRKRNPPDTLHRDWAISLGPNATVGAGNYPAKFSFDVTTANCGNAAQPDFVVFNTTVGGGGLANIVAYDNLYSGCTGTVPSTYWAYSLGGASATSVVLSLDGSQVAFVENLGAGTIWTLVLLKWAPTTDGATVSKPDPINQLSPSSYPSCTAPCATTLHFSFAAYDTNSSPFYDYANDALYVGDDGGVLHKFQPVFLGIPAEVTTGSWPITLASGFKLSSPVFDSSTGRVFVGSGSDGTSGGQLFSVDATTGSIVQTSAQLAKGNGIASGPIVDSSAGLVYVFVGTDTGAVTCFNGGSPCSGVYQFSVNSLSSGGREAPISWGAATAGFPVYLGAFDNSYYSSANATGSLYACGQIGGRGILFKIAIDFGFLSPSPTNYGFLTGASPMANIPCSSVTEVFNPNLNSGLESGGPQGTDKIFVSTQGTDASACSRAGNGGCLWALPATSWQPGTAYEVGQVVLDDGPDMCLQIVTSAGTSSATTEPNWAVNAGVQTTDGTVTWTGKECLGAVIPPDPWFPGTLYGTGFTVLDTNGNLEAPLNGVTGTTGSTQPVWPTNIGAQTHDGGQIWVNVGSIDVASLQVLGGTSGLIVDNVVLTGGGSQIYFSPLAMGFGTCGAGNGCAVQASQAALK